ncbi:MAG: hypothetical protein IJU64_03675 [Bacilli bacterium]|nr:hypothetical protein [Bacilli bacterium]
MMGHSLGGTSAALFLSGNKDETFKGIIFLASYPNKELNDSYRCLSIYGSNDAVLNKAEYEKNRSNFPAKMTEIVIDGGNHSYFGDYGFHALVTVELRTISRMTVERLTPSFSATDLRVDSGFSDISNSISTRSWYLRCFICFRFLSGPRLEGR